MMHITAPELASWIADDSRAKPVLLDVREPWEFEICHIDGAVAMPMDTVPARYAELDETAAIVCICHHGVRSAQVAAFLDDRGFSEVANLAGGVHAWALQVDSRMPTY
ncbi:MAG TPA: rhodanese-like domain-containing protein [Paucimonas sp.]|nr:rhodanese-like domain-containing protein [Paucimonas sp.]